MASLEQNINQAIADFDAIKAAIEESGVEIPYDTDTSEYGNKVKEVFDKGYSDGEVVGIEEGKQSMVDESKIIEKTVTSQGIVSVNDVSEIPHDISVKLTSDTVEDISTVKLLKQGKNLLNEKAVAPIAVNAEGVTRYGWDLGVLPQGNYTLTAYGNYVKSKTVSYKIITNGVYGEYISLDENTKTKTITLNGSQGLIVYLYQDVTDLYDNVTLQLEVGDKTEYEPYIEPTVYDVSADGTVEGVKSISPNMTLFTDADVEIEMIYHKSWGMQTEYDRFWDTYQQCGKRTQCNNMFYNNGWTDDIYNPKYPFVVTEISNAYTYSQITDTKKDIIFTGGTLYGTFSNATKMKTIRKLSVIETTVYNSTFNTARALENIVMEGIIGSTINFQWSTLLTAESAISIINCLKDYTGTDQFGTYTLTFADEVWTRLETVTPPDEYTSWKNYVEDKGWLT